jgi:hypothetical protein
MVRLIIMQTSWEEVQTIHAKFLFLLCGGLIVLMLIPIVLCSVLVL